MAPVSEHFAPDVKTTPYWWEAVPLTEFPEAPLPRTVDLAIVGSGYAGLSAALTAAENGMSTLVLESEAIGEGASTRNGGAVGETLRLSFATMERKLGRDRAIAFYVAVREARSHLEHLIETGS